MNIFRFAFELFVLYIVYKAVVDFIIPIYRTTKQMKGKMAEMQERMSQQQRQTNFNSTTPQQQASRKSNNEDYIDYEEIK